MISVMILHNLNKIAEYFTVKSVFIVGKDYGCCNLTLPLFIEVPVPSRESEWSYITICVLGVSILPLSVIFLLNFGTVSTVWYFFVSTCGYTYPCFIFLYWENTATKITLFL